MANALDIPIANSALIAFLGAIVTGYPFALLGHGQLTPDNEYQVCASSLLYSVFSIPPSISQMKPHRDGI